MTKTLPHQILVALSFTDDPLDPGFDLVESDRALIAQALWYARKTCAQITFAHCIEQGDSPLPFRPDSLHEVLRECIAPILEELVCNALEEGVQAQHRLFVGSVAWHRMLLAAKEEGYDLIMSGPRRKDQGVLDWIFHGSTTRGLLRNSSVPVWVTSPDYGCEMRKILVPVDFSSVSRDSVEFANKLAEFNGAERILVHFPDFSGEISAWRSPNSEEAVKEYRKEVFDAAHEKIHRFLGDDADKWKVVVTQGDAARGTAEIAEREGVDLVVMGSVARTGLSGFVMGNTAEKMLSHLKSPLWVIKPNDWQSPV